MKNYKHISLITFIIIFFVISDFALPQIITSIAEIKENDSQGIPKLINTIVVVRGVATATNHFGSSGPGAIQDNTGAIWVYGSNFAGAYQIGDSVLVKGRLEQFYGLTQINVNAPGGVVSLIKQNSKYDTIIVTIKDIINQNWQEIEVYEGQLIRINNVTIQAAGSFQGNRNYTIYDNTATLTNGLRIDADASSLVGQPIPTGPIDIIGILGQYKTSAPYNSGYQLLPRGVNDLIYQSPPLIIPPVLASNITTNSFTIYFRTARQGYGKVRYGKTSSLELGEITSQNFTTTHQLQVGGLEPNTRYFYQAIATNQNGTSQSSIQSVTTSSLSDPDSRIYVYFNNTVDHSVAIPGNEAMGNVNFAEKLIEMINKAEYSIDIALYSFFGLNNVVSALLLAKDRGVKIRFIYENRTNQDNAQALIDAGIPYIKRNPSLDGIMHNKFFIFDARDNNPNNDYVWTGSWNATSTELNWKNNVIIIKNAAVAQAYTQEFEEMWGSSTDSPNPDAAKFGAQKTDNVSHAFNVGGKYLYVYFSPSDGVEPKIVNELNAADSSIYFCQYAFTSDGVFNAISSAKVRGVPDIRGVITETTITGSKFTQLKSICEVWENAGYKSHHKYGIIDASYIFSEPTVITGSHNWTLSANTINDENTIIIKDAFIANQFLQEFKKRYNDAGGTGIFKVPNITSVDNFVLKSDYFEIYQNYPNPFNNITTISFSLSKSSFVELSIYDIYGREVKKLYHDYAQQGKTAIDFKADDLASGIYYYRIKLGESYKTKKMILLK